MPFPLIPLAIMGGAKLFSGIMKGRAAKKKAKEKLRADTANIDAKYGSDVSRFDNSEDDRLARMQHIAGQLKGNRALSPEVIAAALKRRRNTAYKGSAMDESKGIGSQMAAGIGDTVGDFAGAYMKGAGMPQGAPEGMSQQFLTGIGGTQTPRLEDEEF
jgi:hypothetical protein